MFQAEIPVHRLPWERFKLLRQDKTFCVIPRFFRLTEYGGRFQQRLAEGFLHIPDAHDPGGDPVDCGVKIIQTDVHTGNTVSDDFGCDHLEFVVEQHHMIAVPADGTADMQKDLIQEKQHGTDFVADLLSRMKMPGVQAQHQAVLHGIAQIKLMRTDRTAFHPDSKELALNGIPHQGRIPPDGINLIQRLRQTFPRRSAIHGNILESVRNPGVHDAARPESAPHFLRNSAAGLRMGDPEGPHPGIRTRQGQTARRHRM